MDTELFSDEIRRRERARRRKEPLWSLASFLFHCVLLVVIVLCTPVKELIKPEPREPADAAKELSSDRMEEIAEQLAQARVNELLRQIQEMQTVLHNMDLMKEELQEDYDKFAADSAESVKEQLEKFANEVEAQQKKALEAQPKAAEVAKQIDDAIKSDLNSSEVAKQLLEKGEQLRDHQAEAVSTAQANAANQLDRIQVQAEFAGYKKSSEMAEKVREAQIEASRLQSIAQDDVIDSALMLRDQARNATQNAESKAKVAENKAKKAENEEKKSVAEKAREVAKAEKQQLQQQVTELRKEKKWKEAEEVKQQASVADRKYWEENRKVQDSERAVRDATRSIEWHEKRIAETDSNLAKLKETLNAYNKREDLKKLENAKKQQERVAETIALLKETIKNDESEIEKLVQENRQENKLVTEDAREMKMVEAFELAKQLENAITESFKDIKATQTALQKKMSFEAAQKITDVAKPKRIEADKAAIEETVRNKEALDRQKAAQLEVVREADNMVEATVQMMKQAMEIVMASNDKQEQKQENAQKSVEWMKKEQFADRSSDEAREERLKELNDEADLQVALQEAAAEGENNQAKDMAELMAKNADASASARDAGGKKSGELDGPPQLKGGSIDLLPGNILHVANDESGIPGAWMYINSWYVIGPFPNPKRINLRRKFAPESVIDLDANYPGKDGKTISWQFMQANNINQINWWGGKMNNAAQVVPKAFEEYVIYYAYTEVFVDEECDRWIYIGSDDRSDVWLNDMPVWASSNQLKEWHIDEGPRKVHFKKGRNKILARIENGHMNFGWSVCISVSDQRAPIK